MAYAVDNDHGLIRLWDVEQARPLRELQGHAPNQATPERAFVHALAFHPGGELLASAGGDGKVKVWDVLARELRRTIDFAARYDRANAVTFSADGTLLAAGADGQGKGRATVWKTATWKVDYATDSLGYRVRAVAISRDNQRLALAGEFWDRVRMKVLRDELTICSLVTQRVMARVEKPESLPHKACCVGFAADDRLLAFWEGDTKVRFWDGAPSRWRETRTVFHAPNGSACATTLSPDGRHFATANSDGTVYLFRLASASGAGAGRQTTASP